VEITGRAMAHVGSRQVLVWVGGVAKAAGMMGIMNGEGQRRE